MKNIYIQKLCLENYRNFGELKLEVSNKPLIIIGENGSGKTNVLEAMSLLFPGRGLRAAKLDSICKLGKHDWSLQAIMQSKLGLADIQTGFRLQSKRWIEFNGSKIANNELSNLSSMIWLTPQMDGIFLDSASHRRKFLDRIVYNFDPAHAARIGKYEYYIHERINILQQDVIDNSWLKVIEEKIADISLEIAISRLKILEQMQVSLNELETEFPKAILLIAGEIEEKILLRGEAEITDFIKSKLALERMHDKASGRTNFGVHRSDLVVIHQEKNQSAKFCSTGEQKAMLIAIMLAQVNSAIKGNHTAPILLLDEVFVHLDNRRKQYLTDFFIRSGLQIWITATDLSGIEELAGQAELIKL